MTKERLLKQPRSGKMKAHHAAVDRLCSAAIKSFDQVGSWRVSMRSGIEGRRTTSSSCPPIASTQLLSVDKYMSACFSIFETEGCLILRTEAISA